MKLVKEKLKTKGIKLTKEQKLLAKKGEFRLIEDQIINRMKYRRDKEGKRIV